MKSRVAALAIASLADMVFAAPDIKALAYSSTYSVSTAYSFVST